MMTIDEKDRLYDLADEAEARGDIEEAERILMSVPLTPNMAKIVKEVWGKEYIKNSSLNFSEAEEVYGKDWLDR